MKYPRSSSANDKARLTLRIIKIIFILSANSQNENECTRKYYFKRYKLVSTKFNTNMILTYVYLRIVTTGFVRHSVTISRP